MRHNCRRKGTRIMGPILNLVLTNLLVAVLLGATLYSAIRRVHFKGDMSGTNPRLWLWGLIGLCFLVLSVMNHEALW